MRGSDFIQFHSGKNSNPYLDSLSPKELYTDRKTPCTEKCYKIEFSFIAPKDIHTIRNNAKSEICEVVR